MFRKVIILVMVIMLVSGTAFCGEINVSAAISLKNAFEEIGKLYEQTNKEEKVVFNFGGSGALKNQIEGGAPVDIFASAAQKDMNDLSEKGLIIKDSRINFAANAVVLVKPSKSKIVISSFNDLVKDEVKKISVGNPVSVPAGRYAKEVLTNYNLWSKLEAKTVLAENVRQVLDYVVRNEVDAGIVYETDAKTVPTDVIIAAVAPADSHAPVIYPAAVVVGCKNKEASGRFLSMLGSEKGMEILTKYGFSPVK